MDSRFKELSNCFEAIASLNALVGSESKDKISDMFTILNNLSIAIENEIVDKAIKVFIGGIGEEYKKLEEQIHDQLFVEPKQDKGGEFDNESV